MNVVVTGSIAYDYLMSFPGFFKDHILPEQIAKLSVSFLVDSMRRQRGGCATNIAYNLALLGERPLVMATAGQDFADYRAWLEARGVDTSAIVEVPDEFTASFFVSTDRENNQIASFYTGAMAHAHKLSFRDLKTRADLALISPNDPEAMRKYPRECKELGIPYIYDPSQQVIRLSGDDLREGLTGSKLLIVNDYEFEMIRNKTGMSEEQVLCCTGALTVTRGGQGSTIWTGGQRIDIPVVKPVREADPTGVGDAYRAGIIKGMSLGLPWETIGRMGSLAATYVLECPGTQNHSYTWAEFATRYYENFGDTLENTATPSY
jgi:adenosine kinase